MEKAHQNFKYLIWLLKYWRYVTQNKQYSVMADTDYHVFIVMLGVVKQNVAVP